MIDKMVLVYLIHSLWFIPFIIYYRSTPLPTKNLYLLRYDKPIKVGAWYFGKSNIFWGLSLLACLAALYVIDLNSPEMAVAAQSSTEITRGTFAKAIDVILIVAILVASYKVYKAIKEKNTKEEAEKKAKHKLFNLMYHEGKIQLPLKLKDDDSEWIQADKKYTTILSDKYPQQA